MEVAGKPAVTKKIVGVIDRLATKIFDPTDGDDVPEGQCSPRGGTPIRNRLTAEEPKHCRSKRYR